MLKALASLKTRLINALIILAILVGLVLLFWWVLPQMERFRSPPKIANTPVILQEVQTLSQLVTVKYVMEKVVDLSDTQWYKDFLGSWGDSRVLMVAHGIVKAGIDLGEIKTNDITISGKKITLKMPPSRITDTYLDDKHTQVLERSTGLLRTFDKNLEQDARQQAVLDLNRAAREAGILKDADDRAQAQLKNLFHQIGFEQVELLPP